jgi:hypothetical protein
LSGSGGKGAAILFYIESESLLAVGVKGHRSIDYRVFTPSCFVGLVRIEFTTPIMSVWDVSMETWDLVRRNEFVILWKARA